MTHSKKHDYVVIIGRFQPLHEGHVHLIREGLEHGEKVIILVGSSNSSRTVKNPFTFEERETMFHANFETEITRGNLFIEPIQDHLYSNDSWKCEVQTAVSDVIFANHEGEFDADEIISDTSVALVGHSKDESSFYLKEFPQWGQVEVDMTISIDATYIRDLYFNEGDDFNMRRIRIENMCPDGTVEFLKRFKAKQFNEYDRLQNEYVHIEKYKEQWKAAPYPVTFVTTDTVVLCHGHVLLIQRKAAPGEGLWALPGGFLNQGETLESGALRELFEETKINVPKAKVRNSVAASHVFDAPGRSLRGRTITHAFLIDLNNEMSLPKVKGSDDARDARWFSYDELTRMSMNLFEDHEHIIYKMMGLSNT